MLDPNHPIAQLARKDGRYHVDAYTFVFDALHHAHTDLEMGVPSEEATEFDEGAESHRHLTGQQLCHAIRHLALQQYGFMAKCVLNRWGIHRTSDFGNIVYNLIEIEQMRKTDTDRREDFDDVFDFDRDLVEGFEITRPE